MITNAVIKIIYVDDFYLSNVIRYNCIIYCELYPTADDDQYAHNWIFLYVYALIFHIFVSRFVSVELSKLEKISEMKMDRNRSFQDQKRHGTYSPFPPPVVFPRAVVLNIPIAGTL